MPSNTIQVLIDRDRIATRVEEIAAQISRDLADVRVEGEIVLVPILTGSIIFVADLIRHLPHKIRIEVATVQSYYGEKKKVKQAKIIGALPGNVEGKHVLIVDDILDSGETIRLIRNELQRRNPKSIRACVLLRKQRPAAMRTPCEYVGFDIPDEFVVGYGLDYQSYYRNLPDVCTFKGDAP
ncbi:MAG: hypoxanthine phosphoribosyltransferase [Phycisphaerales bacterium]